MEVDEKEQVWRTTVQSSSGGLGGDKGGGGK